MDYGKTAAVPMRFLARELLEFVDDVLDGLGSRQEVEYIHTILEQGTSADRQIETYQQCLTEGASHEEALHSVVDRLIEETMQGVTT